MPGKKVLPLTSFTLIELLIVLSLITVISTAFLILLNPLKQINKAQDSKRISDLSSMNKTFEEYYSDKERYPKPEDVCSGSQSSNGDECSCSICDYGSNDIMKSYTSKLACDPASPKQEYMYFYDCNQNTKFKICSKLSNGEIYCTNSPNTDSEAPIWWYTITPTKPATITPTSKPPTNTITPTSSPTGPSPTPQPTTSQAPVPTPTTHPYDTGACINQSEFTSCLIYCNSIGKSCGKDENGFTYKGYDDSSCSIWNNNLGCISESGNPNNSVCCTQWPYEYNMVKCICWE